MLSSLLPYSSKSCPDLSMQLLVSIAQRATGLVSESYRIYLNRCVVGEYNIPLVSHSSHSSMDRRNREKIRIRDNCRDSHS